MCFFLIDNPRGLKDNTVMDKIEQANEGKFLGTKTTKFQWCCNDVPMLLLASSPFMAREGRTARERASEGRTREVREGGISRPLLHLGSAGLITMVPSQQSLPCPQG